MKKKGLAEDMAAGKKRIVYCGFSLLVLAALCIGILVSARSEAAALPKPSFTVTKRTKTTATIKIKKKGNVTGYQIWTAASKNGKYRQVDGIRSQTCKLKKLKADKVYYVKVRAFKTTKNYHITYGKFSSVVKIGKYQKPKPTPKPTETPEPTGTPDPAGTPDPMETPGPEGTSEPAGTPGPVGTEAAEETGISSEV